MVIIRTTFGEIKLELDAEKAPKTVANFLNYARDGFYDGTIFHRVIDNFMIQGGGFDTDMQQKNTGEPIENEADNGLKNDFGTVAMARTTDPHSATAQFFHQCEGQRFPQPQRQEHAGLGLHGIRQSHRGHGGSGQNPGCAHVQPGGHQDVPTDPVIIESVVIVEE